MFALLLLLNCWNCSDWGWIWVNWWWIPFWKWDSFWFYWDFELFFFPTNCEILYTKKWMGSVGVGPIWSNAIYFFLKKKNPSSFISILWHEWQLIMNIFNCSFNLFKIDPISYENSLLEMGTLDFWSSCF